MSPPRVQLNLLYNPPFPLFHTTTPRTPSPTPTGRSAVLGRPTESRRGFKLGCDRRTRHRRVARPVEVVHLAQRGLDSLVPHLRGLPSPDYPRDDDFPSCPDLWLLARHLRQSEDHRAPCENALHHHHVRPLHPSTTPRPRPREVQSRLTPTRPCAGPLKRS
jgi:hypothetical protein